MKSVASSLWANQASRASKPRRSGEHSRRRTSQDRKSSTEKLSKTTSRSSDDESTTDRTSRSHSFSASSIYSHPHTKLEDIAASPPSSAMTTPRPTSYSKPSQSSSRPSSQFFSNTPVSAFQQPSVEDYLEDDYLTFQPKKTSTHALLEEAGKETRSRSPPIATTTTTTTEPPATTPTMPAANKLPSRTASLSRESQPKEFTVPGSFPAAAPDVKSTLMESQSDRPSSSKRRAEDVLPGGITDIVTSSTTPPMSPIPMSPVPMSPRLYDYAPYPYPPIAESQYTGSRRTSPTPRAPQGQMPYQYGYVSMAPNPPPSSYGQSYYGMPYSAVDPSSYASERARSPSSAEEQQELLGKVAGVLPDINRLLSAYGDSHGQISAKDLLAKQTELEKQTELAKQTETAQSEKLSTVKMELDATKKEYEKVIQAVVAERAKAERDLEEARQRLKDLEGVEFESKKMRKELNALKADRKELSDGLDALRRSREEMQASKLAKEREIESLKKALQTEKDRHHRIVMETKEQARDHLEQKQKDFQRIIGDHKFNYTKVQTELTALIIKFGNQRKDLEVTRSSEAECKLKLNMRTKELDDALLRHAHEMETTKRRHEGERERIARQGEDRLEALSKENAQREAEWGGELHDIGVELETEQRESKKLREELEAEKQRKEEERFQRSVELTEGLALWRAKSEELKEQQQNLDRLLRVLE